VHEAPAPAFDEVVVDGIVTQQCGPRDAPRVVLSAGLGGSGMYWRPQLAALAERFRVVLYDHRGTGKSVRGPLPAPYSASDLADDIRIVMDGLDIAQAHVVGHAAGAVAGLELARVAPERVLSLVAVNGWAVADPHFVRCFEIRKAIYRSEGVAGYLRAQPLFLFPASWISDHLAELDAEAARHAAQFQDEATLFARMGALAAFDIRSALPTMRTPTLVVASADDMLVPARASAALARPLPNATLFELPWGGHAVNVTAAEAFNAQLMSFLTTHIAVATSGGS
jgi:aminoacrylate hydrolase